MLTIGDIDETDVSLFHQYEVTRVLIDVLKRELDSNPQDKILYQSAQLGCINILLDPIDNYSFIKVIKDFKYLNHKSSTTDYASTVRLDTINFIVKCLIYIFGPNTSNILTLGQGCIHHFYTIENCQSIQPYHALYEIYKAEMIYVPSEENLLYRNLMTEFTIKYLNMHKLDILCRLGRVDDIPISVFLDGQKRRYFKKRLNKKRVKLAGWQVV